MNFLKAHKLLLLSSALTVVVVAGLTVTITWAAGITFEGGQPEPAQGLSVGQETDAPQAWVQQPKWSLQSDLGGRRSFNFCVDTFGLAEPSSVDSLRDEGKDAVNEAIGALRTHSFWALANLERALPAVYVEGCPEPPFPSRTDEEWVNGRVYGGIGQEYAKQTISDYFFHVFVMPVDQIDELLGGTTTRVVGQEFQCTGHVCGPESFAIYLTPEELANDAESVRFVMEQAFGFE